MKIIVFGATGRTGSKIVKQALEKGHLITAFVRDEKKINLLHQNLTIIKGDVLNIDQVSAAMTGKEAVISALNADDHNHRKQGIQNIITAMKKQGVKRIIAIGGLGALQANETLKVYETPQFPKQFIEVTQAHLQVYYALSKSDLDFTLVCPPMIPDGDKTGKYTTKANYPTAGWSISTGDLADFMITELRENKYIKNRVGISNI